MITIKTNAASVIKVLVTKLKSLADNDRMLRTCATTALGLMKKRIHEDGLDASERPIGNYSKGYMILRTGAYGNAARVSRGSNKGKLKNAGVFTDRTIRLDKNTGVFSGDEKTGTARPKYNRTGDTKVVLSLTRQMENDMKVIAISAGVYGIGYSNPLNYQKSQYNEQTYRRPGGIFRLSPSEEKAVQDIAEKFTRDALSQ